MHVLRRKKKAITYSYTAWYSTTLSAAVCNTMPNGMNTTPIAMNVPITHYINIIHIWCTNSISLLLVKTSMVLCYMCIYVYMYVHIYIYIYIYT
jgi:hypothetical protein